MLESGRASLVFAAASVLATCVVFVRVIRALVPALLTPVVVVFASAAQAFWIFSNAAFGGTTYAPALNFPLDISDQPILATSVLLLVPLGAVCASIILSVTRNIRASSRSMLGRDLSSDALKPYLALGAALLVLYWPASALGSGGVGYLIRVTNTALLFLPFFAGRYVPPGGALAYAWYAVLATGAIVGLLAGTRFPALLPIALFVVGRISIATGRRRVKLVVIAVLGAIPALAVSGLIGIVRTEVGRGGVEILSAERVIQVFEASMEILSEPKHDSPDRGEGLKAEGLARMVSWPNIVVTLLSPDFVPYRGVDGYWDELKASASIASLSGKSREDLYEEGLYSAPATAYGYFVNAGNSVEFGLIADGWSRNGPWLVLLFGFLASMFIGFVEFFAVCLGRRWPAAAMLIFTTCVHKALETVNLPLAATIRSLVLHTLLIMTLSAVFELIRHLGRRHRGSPRGQVASGSREGTRRASGEWPFHPRPPSV